ncbi:hypothetical protein VTL71DRAFT_1113 [Oculimacula yallundae]|uniref:Heterokaryon incompatibility domain-containing protein n=1 Tax=Oculimacula yallundae TaxID=86028 RepID=A0ABR4D237_9HELO
MEEPSRSLRSQDNFDWLTDEIIPQSHKLEDLADADLDPALLLRSDLKELLPISDPRIEELDFMGYDLYQIKRPAVHTRKLLQALQRCSAPACKHLHDADAVANGPVGGRLSRRTSPKYQIIYSKWESGNIVDNASLGGFFRIVNRYIENSASFRYAAVYQTCHKSIVIIADFTPFSYPDLSLFSGLGRSTASAQAWKAASKWHKNCTRGHKDCQQNDVAYIPTRLIDVGKSLFGSPRLVLASDLQPGVKFATLSHCWGHSMHIRLLSCNLTAFRKQLPLKDLSKVFTDAFKVTRFFDLRYLWIDSLCILQDSAEDWAFESSAMSKIYSNGYCNIAATCSLDGSEGLFRKRNPRAIGLAKIPLPRQSIKLGRHCWVVNDKVWQQGVEDAPLNRRGWVCQERLLSPRTLHFGIDQLYWECRTQTCCEIYPAGLPYVVPGVSQTKSMFTKAESQLLDSSMNDRNAGYGYGYHLWSEIVDKYSRSALTHESDKLVAVAGLAVEIQRMVKDDYYAGLWRRHFIAQLLWMAKPEEPNHGNGLVSTSQAPQYVAPTWSWASLQCPVELVYFDPEYHQPVAQVIDIGVQLAVRNSTFGAITQGWVQIRGSLAKVSIIKIDDQLRLHFSPNSSDCLQWIPDPSLASQITTWSICETQISNSRLNIFPNSAAAFEDSILARADETDNYLYFLVLQSSSWSSCAGLILQRRGEDQDPDTFEKQFENFDDGCLAEGLDFYEQEEGGLWYDITII